MYIYICICISSLNSSMSGKTLPTRIEPTLKKHQKVGWVTGSAEIETNSYIMAQSETAPEKTVT